MFINDIISTSMVVHNESMMQPFAKRMMVTHLCALTFLSEAEGFKKYTQQ